MVKRRLVFIICLFLLLSACSDKLSPYFSYNRYINDFYDQIVNDSLKIYIRTPADIGFFKDKRSANKEIRDSKLRIDNVLVCGKTNIDPYYEFFILHNKRSTLKFKDSLIFQFDSVINNQRFSIVAIPLDNNTISYKIDCRDIFNSIIADSSYQKNIVSLNSVMRSFYKSNCFYQALSEISNYPAYDENVEGFKFQMQLTYASFLGGNKDYYDYLSKWEIHFRADSLIKECIQNKSIKGTAETKKLILDQSRKCKLVMFNENHFYPNHRKLVLSLLPDFKSLGFNYLALETLGEKQDSVLNSGAALTIESGFYTRESHYAELIRTAQKLGFKFVAYENTDDSKDREVGEAENLYNRTFKKDTSAKVLVLAGISHIFESADDQGKEWMASIFKSKYGIDPLTFNQTDLSLYRKPITDIAILKSNDLKSAQYTRTDWQIINNLPLVETSGNFKYKNEFKESVQLALFLSSDLNGKKFTDNKVPYRSFLLHEGDTYITAIPPQEYRLVLFDRSGRKLKSEIINTR